MGLLARQHFLKINPWFCLASERNGVPTWVSWNEPPKVRAVLFQLGNFSIFLGGVYFNF